MAGQQEQKGRVGKAQGHRLLLKKRTSGKTPRREDRDTVGDMAAGTREENR